MKKIIFIIFIVLSVFLSGCSSNDIGSNGATSQIDVNQAKEIAIDHAQIEGEPTFVKSELEIDDGVSLYEIEFYYGNTEYDYEIEAATGKIISFDSDIEEYEIPKEDGNISSTEGSITKLEAEEIAVKHSNISGEPSFIKSELEIDDGISVYEIEFYYGNTEYDYEINATTGEVISFDKDVE